MGKGLVSVIFRMFHFLFNDKQGCFLFKGGNHDVHKFDLDVLQHKENLSTRDTILLYPSIDEYINSDKHVNKKTKDFTLLIEDLILVAETSIKSYMENYNIKNIIILSVLNNNKPFLYKIALKNAFPNQNIYILNNADTIQLKHTYSPNLIHTVIIDVKPKLEYIYFIILYIFYISLFISVYKFIKLCIIIRQSKEPIITIDALRHIKKLKFKDLNQNLKANNSCLICFDEYLANDMVRLLACDHFFHVACIDPWLTRKCARCPLCRRGLVLEV
ncbi:hypothetical protein EDEG_00975 [Edhazardia aedis USNM 41457]|uniref:RING-type domain-containing protein n=1 Tax=Edhazardia aedis (strain USNM 41457) TaxID=1003232 RepID=J8ZYT3_EDHAE|nr:hypothetical protein EDEG_00975 [Edhazardia aedis USNM 41457]|eukprot:EJW04838.1 hypothetical protein EDEG_00975 [Edhazardia aedis USNM 41457]